MEKNQTTQWDELYQSFFEKLTNLKETKNDFIQIAQKAMEICINYLNTIKLLVAEHGFSNKAEEINFFKHYKPKFHSQLIFYSKAFNIELKKPVGAKATIEEYYQRHLLKIKIFFENHIETYQYYRSNSTFLDDRFFLRTPTNTQNFYHHRLPDIDPSFTTDKDYLFSQIIASELLSQFLQDSIAKLQREPAKSGYNTEEKTLVWTDSKVAFVEWVYAVKAKGSFNNGSASLAFHFEQLGKMFGIENINSSRVFQEILSRQKGPAIYTSELVESLLKWVNRVL